MSEQLQLFPISSTKRLVLVTGGAGYIGSVLCRHLLEAGYRVRVLDLFHWSAQPLATLLRDYPGDITLMVGDVCDPPSAVFADVYAVCHLAGFSNDPTADADPELNKQVNHYGTARLAAAAKHCGIQRFIYASSASLYDGTTPQGAYAREDQHINPLGHYSWSKWAGENELLLLGDYSFRPIILRQGTVHGLSPRMRFDLVVNTMTRAAMTSGEIHIHGGGHNWRPIIGVDALASVYVQLLNLPSEAIPPGGRIYNVASQNASISTIAYEVMQGVHTLTGMRPRRIDVPFAVGQRIRDYRMSSARLNAELGIIPVVDELRGVAAMIVDAYAPLGRAALFAPQYSNIEWMREQGARLLSTRS